MRIKLATPLIGEFPRYANVKLPDNAAVIAQNMRLDSGVLKPLNGYTTGATLLLLLIILLLNENFRQRGFYECIFR